MSREDSIAWWQTIVSEFDDIQDAFEITFGLNGDLVSPDEDNTSPSDKDSDDEENNHKRQISQNLLQIESRYDFPVKPHLDVRIPLRTQPILTYLISSTLVIFIYASHLDLFQVLINCNGMKTCLANTILRTNEDTHKYSSVLRELQDTLSSRLPVQVPPI